MIDDDLPDMPADVKAPGMTSTNLALASVVARAVEAMPGPYAPIVLSEHPLVEPHSNVRVIP